MQYVYQIVEEDKDFFREELGKVLNGKSVVQKAKKIIDGKKLYCVGDRSSSTFIEEGIVPDLFIWDGKVERKVKDLGLDSVDVRKYETVNPKGKITVDAYETIKKAMENMPAKIKVKGEEDLLATCVMHLADVGDCVVYGLPNKGLTVVEITENLKSRVNQIIDFEKIQ